MTLATRLKATGKTLVTGSFGAGASGNLSIPQGCGLVSLSGRGANGGDDSWYDPGQPYIAPTAWSGHYVETGTISLGTYSTLQYNYWSSTPPWAPSGPSDSGTHYWNVYDSGSGLYYAYRSTYATVTDTAYNPGQPYIAPSSGGGPTYGASTTATLNGATATFIGGYGSGVVGSTTNQSLTSTGAGQTMTYYVGSPNGTLSYSYEY